MAVLIVCIDNVLARADQEDETDQCCEDILNEAGEVRHGGTAIC